MVRMSGRVTGVLAVAAGLAAAPNAKAQLFRPDEGDAGQDAGEDQFFGDIAADPLRDYDPRAVSAATVLRHCDTPDAPSLTCQALVLGLYNGFVMGVAGGHFAVCVPDDIRPEDIVSLYLARLDQAEADNVDPGYVEAAMVMSLMFEELDWGGFDEDACAGPADTMAGAPPPAEDPAVIEARVAEADASMGEDLYRQCRACHTADFGQPHAVGPNLWAIVNRPIAGHADYAYSAALHDYAAEAGTWSIAALDAYLTKPREAVPGTLMTYVGMSDPAERAALIAYLQTLAAD